MIHESRKYYSNSLDSEQIRRMKICKHCPLNSDNKKEGLKSKIFKMLNKTLDWVYGMEVSDGAVCLDCGCNIIVKSKYDICNKWE